jgi:hypothetical protein|nr:MAG TPA: EscU cleavage protein, flagella, Intein.2A [Caudoviricetes sp.]
MKTLYKSIVETAEQAGIKVLSDARCCQLLAWVLEIGGYTEESTHNLKLNQDILMAQKRLNILGGETPNTEMVTILKKYHSELLNYLNKKTKKPQWLIDFENYYKLKPYNNN